MQPDQKGRFSSGDFDVQWSRAIAATAKALGRDFVTFEEIVAYIADHPELDGEDPSDPAVQKRAAQLRGRLAAFRAQRNRILRKRSNASEGHGDSETDLS